MESKVSARPAAARLPGTRRTALIRGAGAGALLGALLVRLLASRLPPDSVLARVQQTLRAAGSGFGAVVLASLGLWVAFSVYWEIAAARAAPVERAESTASRRVHLGLVSLGQLLVFLPIPTLRARFLPPVPALAALGLAVQVGFLLMAIWARRTLGRSWSAAVATTAEQTLVRAGPYRTVRHPIYAALLGMYAGTTLVSGEVHALLGCAFLVLAYWRKIRLEEQLLADVYGPEYDAYRRDSWRLLPGVY